jgi:hypothetical protein
MKARRMERSLSSQTFWVDDIQDRLREKNYTGQIYLREANAAGKELIKCST